VVALAVCARLAVAAPAIAGSDDASALDDAIALDDASTLDDAIALDDAIPVDDAAARPVRRGRAGRTRVDVLMTWRRTTREGAPGADDHPTRIDELWIALRWRL